MAWPYWSSSPQGLGERCGGGSPPRPSGSASRRPAADPFTVPDAEIALSAVVGGLIGLLRMCQRHPDRGAAGPVFGHLLLSLVDLAAGVIALAWPGPTALVLVLIVGIWAVIVGVAEIAAAFAAGEPAGTRALFILAGLISVAFGVVLCARPHVGAITLALLFGQFNLIIGIWMIVQGIELRRTGKTLDSGFPEKQPA
jgi:uncharacterized membrane protein HdeD (DUF308 family)